MSFKSPTITETIVPNINSHYQSMPWLVQVGWLKGKVNRDIMINWCMEHLDSDKFAWDKGGNWWFLSREDAVAFFMVHCG